MINDVDFKNILNGFPISIRYEPIEGEIDYLELELFSKTHPKAIIILPKNPDMDPLSCALDCISKYGSDQAHILIPGQMFDIKGTRHGRGRGWYDRFLSKVPRNWLRIGICDESSFSESPIERKEWDEPMDLIFVQAKEKWRIFDVRG